jgi:cold-inducible RNA-binding protein
MNRNLKTRMLYIRNLSDDTTEADLRNFFGQYGLVTGVILKRDHTTDASWGHGYVEMESALISKIAIKQADGQVLNDRQITVMKVRN